ETRACAYPEATGGGHRYQRAPAATVMPMATSALFPHRFTRRPETGDTRIRTNATGATRVPACNAEYPSTNCRYCVRKKSEPKSAKKTSVIEMFAAVKRGFRKNSRFNIGWSLRISHTTNVDNTAIASPNAARISGSVQP